jgi:hypothetical protein
MTAHTPEETHALLAAAFNAGDLEALVEVYEEDAALSTMTIRIATANDEVELRRLIPGLR